MTMKRKSRSSSEAIDCIEFSREATKFDSDLQYLQRGKNDASYISRILELFASIGILYRYFKYCCDLILQELFFISNINLKKKYSLCYFEYPEQPDATEHGNAKRRHYTCICKYHFGNRTDHDEAIETIKQRDEITLRNKLW